MRSVQEIDKVINANSKRNSQLQAKLPTPRVATP